MIKLARNIGIAAALFTSSAALADDSGWVISEANGQVSVTRDDKAIYGAQGTELEVGDVIRTTKAASAVLVRGDEFYIVAPNKQVRIIKVEEDSTATKILKFVGNMLPSGEKHGRLNKPTEAAVVKGYGSGVEQSLVQNSDHAAEDSDTAD